MAIEWTDKAVKIAISRYLDRGPDETGWEGMRAALDAAVKAQGQDFYEAIYEAVRHRGRAEAFEEAEDAIRTKIANHYDHAKGPYLDAIEIIRALAKISP